MKNSIPNRKSGLRNKPIKSQRRIGMLPFHAKLSFNAILKSVLETAVVNALPITNPIKAKLKTVSLFSQNLG
jgi:hypothetical protein